MASRATKRRTRDQIPAPATASGPPRPGRRKLFVLLLGLCLVLAVGWFSGAFANVPILFARRALTSHREDTATFWLDWAKRLNGSAVETELLSARIERRQGEFEAMLAHLKNAAELGADRKRVHLEEVLAAAQTGQLQEIEPQLKAWLANPGQDGIEICEAYINGLTMLGRLADAQVLINAWASDAPSDPEPNFRRGRIKEHLRALDEAEKEYQAALAKDPSYAPALYALGRLLLQQKRPREALPLFQQCQQSSPLAAVPAQVGTAMCLRSLGKVDEARRLLEPLVNLDLRQRDQAYSRVREVPKSDPAAFELGKLESDEGKYEVAEKFLRQTVDSNSRDLEARYAWAVALRGLGRNEDAQREFEYVTRARRILAETDTIYDQLSNNPEDVEARYKMGVAYLQYRSESAGLYWLNSALTFDPNHRPTHEALADYYRDHAKDSPAYAKLAEYHRAKAQP